jgi:hypothetical protein
VLVGLLAGYARGGSLRNTEGLRLNAPWLVLLSLVVQVVIFSPLGAPLGEMAGLVLHLATYGLLLLFVVWNRDNAGVTFAGVGIAANAIVIAANGGYMPASRRALEMAGRLTEDATHNNSAVADHGARLLVLGDVMATPEWVPLVANVFSAGDVLIAGGVAMMLATAMREPGTPWTFRAPISGGRAETS